MERQRLGWTMEQRTGVKRYFTMGTVLVALAWSYPYFSSRQETRVDGRFSRSWWSPGS